MTFTKYSFISLFIFLTLFQNIYANNSNSRLILPGTLPILHEGRIKPLDTFAKTILQSFSGNETIISNNIKLNALEWLTKLIFHPQESYSDNIFKIRNADVLNTLKLSNKTNSLYNYSELFNSFKKHTTLISALQKKEYINRTKIQNKIINIYNKISIYHEISCSLSMILPIKFSPKIDLKLKKIFKEKIINYVNLINNLDKIKEIGNEEKNLIIKKIKKINWDDFSSFLCIIPHEEKSLISPWNVIISSDTNIYKKKYITLLNNLTSSFYNNNELLFFKNINDLKVNIYNIILLNDSWAKIKIKFEFIYNKLFFSKKSLIIYSLSLIVLLFSFIKFKKFTFLKHSLTKISFYLTILGISLHIIDIIMRTIILSRPPVSNLYESIIFSGGIAVLLALIIYIYFKDNITLFIAIIAGIILQYIGIMYKTESDTMGMLVAVLNSKFWLISHVLIITIGYGLCIVISLMSHAYLFSYSFNLNNKKFYKKIFSHLNVLTNSALFFVIIGTILGGIWADQSWGRFWGWDPKENGALLIILWLLLCSHGKIGNFLTPLQCVRGLALLSIIIAFAWIGVNLLNVGLHSYGFAEGTFNKLIIFCTTDLSIIISLWFINKKKYLN